MRVSQKLIMAGLGILLPFIAHADANLDDFRHSPMACNGYPNEVFNNQMGQTMEQMIVRIRCQDLRGGLRAVRMMERLILQEMERGSTTEYGICYEERNCRVRASQSTPTKAMCKASEGKSWKRTKPTVGTCQNI
jgi:hypothetical protein